MHTSIKAAKDKAREKDQVEHTKFAGGIVNSMLTWKDHIKTVRNKINKSLGSLE